MLVSARVFFKNAEQKQSKCVFILILLRTFFVYNLLYGKSNVIDWSDLALGKKLIDPSNIKNMKLKCLPTLL